MAYRKKVLEILQREIEMLNDPVSTAPPALRAGLVSGLHTAIRLLKMSDQEIDQVLFLMGPVKAKKRER